MALSRGTAKRGTQERDYEAQYHWLLDWIDSAALIEKEFLAFLHSNDLRLPDHAQYRPSDEVPVQTDFYYERDGLPGICIFIDGPTHDKASQETNDRNLRESLEDRGLMVVTIRYDRSIAEQCEEHKAVFAPGK